MILFIAATNWPTTTTTKYSAGGATAPRMIRTTFDTKNLVEDLSFSIDDVPNLSHYKTVVNGIELHYVIGGKGDPIVLLHGWPETWYEWRHIIPELIVNNFTVILLI